MKEGAIPGLLSDFHVVQAFRNNKFCDPIGMEKTFDILMYGDGVKDKRFSPPLSNQIITYLRAHSNEWRITPEQHGFQCWINREWEKDNRRPNRAERRRLKREGARKA